MFVMKAGSWSHDGIHRSHGRWHAHPGDAGWDAGPHYRVEQSCRRHGARPRRCAACPYTLQPLLKNPRQLFWR